MKTGGLYAVWTASTLFCKSGLGSYQLNILDIDIRFNGQNQIWFLAKIIWWWKYLDMSNWEVFDINVYMNC